MNYIPLALAAVVLIWPLVSREGRPRTELADLFTALDDLTDAWTSEPGLSDRMKSALLNVETARKNFRRVVESKP